MYAYLFPELFGRSIPMFDLMIVIGCCAMVFYVYTRLRKMESFRNKDIVTVVVLIIWSLFVALLTSWLADGLFHSLQDGESSFGSITFLGGLAGGVGFFLLMVRFVFKELIVHLHRLMNVILTGVVLAHGFGRVGCFCAGCCYGIPTASCLGVKFPYGLSKTEYDTAVFPTQLFEAIFLFTLFILLTKVERFKKFQVEVYLILYGIFRFFLEFLRGDDRGVILPIIVTQYNVYPSPSQLMSLGLVALGVFYVIRHRKQATVAI